MSLLAAIKTRRAKARKGAAKVAAPLGWGKSRSAGTGALDECQPEQRQETSVVGCG